jgi:hypothetical protein
MELFIASNDINNNFEETLEIGCCTRLGWNNNLFTYGNKPTHAGFDCRIYIW